MAESILVHGGLHGAWCWELLETELRRLGHRTFAMDLPVDRPGASMDDYAAAVVSSVAGKAGEGAYLVGHSMGGMVIPRVAAARPSDRLIFLCAGFAHTSEQERLEGVAATTKDFYDWLIPDDQGRVTMSRENAFAAFYHDASPALADWAVARLRPQWVEGWTRVGPVPPYASRVAHVIHTSDDRIIDPELHRRMAETRFGITPIALPGGHSPFLSHPAKLAEVLNEIVAADSAARRYVPN